MSHSLTWGVTTDAGVDAVYAPASREATEGLFDVVVFGANEFELRPRTALARSLLAMWVAMDMRPALLCRMGKPVEEGAWGKDVTSMRFKGRCTSLLSRGDDPFYTGQYLSPEEYAACRELLVARRTAEEETKKQPSPTTAKKRRRRP